MQAVKALSEVFGDEAMAESANPLDELSESERKAAKRLLKLCREMADNYGDDE